LEEKELGAENMVTCLGVNSNPDSEWFHRTRASDFETNVGKKVGFDASSPRFNFN